MFIKLFLPILFCFSLFGDEFDLFPFGNLAQHIHQLEVDGHLKELVVARREEIEKIKHNWQTKIPSFEERGFIQQFYRALEEGVLKSSEHGAGSAYILYDANQKPLYVVKPFDEDILCLNNRKSSASPYNDRIIRVRSHIPLYRGAQTEVLAYNIAKLLHLEYLLPETHLAVFFHEAFFDIENHAYKYEFQEKLCSVQSYLTDCQNMDLLIKEWVKGGVTDQGILELIDREDFENLTLLIWLLYDTDAHMGNIYAHKDEKGIYHLRKIDNGLCFPIKNSQLLNTLYFFPHAKEKLSERICTFISQLPIQEMESRILFFEMEDTLFAFRQRVALLQECAKEGKLTIRQIDKRLRTLK